MDMEMVERDVEVVFRDGSGVAGTFFLEPASPLNERGQSLLDLLNGPRRFLPLRTPSGEVLILQKNAIVMVRSTGREIESSMPYARIIPVRMDLLSGVTLEGSVYQDLPLSYPRISDFLNFSLQFFCLAMQDVDCFVNSEMVRSVSQG
ncbi:MAG: hypothetical protein ACOC0U_07615 [Desulfovibrionales bacterium]